MNNNLNIITKKEEKKVSIVDLQNHFNEEGVKFGTITVDGVVAMGIGYSSEQDKEKAISCYKDCLEACNNDVYKTNAMFSSLANLGDIKADKEIEINNNTFIISYAKRAAYNFYGKEITNLEDLGEVELPKIAIETILTERIKNILNKEEFFYKDEEERSYKVLVELQGGIIDSIEVKAYDEDDALDRAKEIYLYRYEFYVSDDEE